MADQVNPTGGLAPGLPLTILVATAPKQAKEIPSQARSADTQSAGPVSRPAVESMKTSEAAVAQINEHFQQVGSELKIQKDKTTGRTVFKVTNPNTGEVIIQVPSEEVLALARNLRSLEKQQGASGVLMDKEG